MLQRMWMPRLSMSVVMRGRALEWSELPLRMLMVVMVIRQNPCCFELTGSAAVCQTRFGSRRDHRLHQGAHCLVDGAERVA